MSVTHTDRAKGPDMLYRLLLARDRGTVVLSPKLEMADLLTSAWIGEDYLTSHYDVELMVSDDGVVTVEPRRIGTRAVREPLTLVAAVRGTRGEGAHTVTVSAHLELSSSNSSCVNAYTDESVDELGFFPSSMSLRNHLLEPEYLSNLVLRHIQRLIEEPHGRRTSWL